MIKVLVAETNHILRGGIQSSLASAADIEIAAEVATPDQLFSSLMKSACDILLIEAEFLQRVTIQALDELLYGQPAPRTIVFSHLNNPIKGLRALQNGAAAYLTKCCSPAELREAIARVAAGKRYIDRTLADELTSFLLVAPNSLPQLLLSLRELQIYKMLILGLTLSGIAAQLNISIHAARFNQARIAEKMQLDGIAELLDHSIEGAARIAKPAD